jgi:hypothetical protein
MADAYDPDRLQAGEFQRARMWTAILAALGTAVGGLFGRAVVGVVGLMVIVGAMLPHQEPTARTPSETAGPPFANRVTLTIPEGESARSLSIIDESGRELALLTRWNDGGVALAARRPGGPGVCFWLKESGGTAFLNLIGSARETHIDVQPDGTVTIPGVDISGQLQPSGPPHPMKGSEFYRSIDHVFRTAN